MCTYNTISSYTDHFEIQKRDSEESLLIFVNLAFTTVVHQTLSLIWATTLAVLSSGSATLYGSNQPIGAATQTC